MPSPRPLSPSEVRRLRGRHLADQRAGARRHRTLMAPCVLAASYLLLLAYLMGGGYGAGAASGLLPTAPWSALAGTE